ncbi:hypothetical protein AeMF1_006853 [Aphanomyces euteiches]|nr:hypothetical protein AeMF1_006853 [Aphanomyces euteiches]KAH9193244.1 hypothetical protein AeNC1_004780 [Aphanomyces euteiches]
MDSQYSLSYSPMVPYMDMDCERGIFGQSTMLLSPESEVAIIRALLRWGELKCQTSYDHLKQLNLPFLNRLIAATETVVGRIGLQRWVDSLAAYCDPLTASIDKYLAQHLLSTLAFALEHPNRERRGVDEEKLALENRIRELEGIVDEYQVKYLKEKHKKDQLQHELTGARLMHKESAIQAWTKINKLEEEVKRVQAQSNENSLRAWSRISTLEEELAAATQPHDVSEDTTDGDGECANDIETKQTSSAKSQELVVENATLKSKLKHTEQKLMWTMLVLSMQKKDASR